MTYTIFKFAKFYIATLRAKRAEILKIVLPLAPPPPPPKNGSTPLGGRGGSEDAPSKQQHNFEILPVGKVSVN